MSKVWMLLGLVACGGPGTAPLEEFTPSGPAPGVVDAGPEAAILFVDAQQDGASVVVGVTFGGWVQDQTRPIWFEVDGLRLLLDVVIVDGYGELAIDLPNPCAEFGSTIEVTAAYGGGDPVGMAVDLVGEVVDPEVRTLHVRDVPLALCGSRTVLDLQVPGGEYQLRAEYAMTLSDDHRMVSGGDLQLALDAGVYRLEIAEGPYTLTVVSR